jgi:broad specificity phosphatase PhoE
VLALPRPVGDIAVVAHGAVGALLLCALEKAPISRDADQPPGGGGFYVSVDLDTRCLRQGWRAIDA